MYLIDFTHFVVSIHGGGCYLPVLSDILLIYLDTTLHFAPFINYIVNRVFCHFLI